MTADAGRQWLGSGEAWRALVGAVVVAAGYVGIAVARAGDCRLESVGQPT